MSHGLSLGPPGGPVARFLAVLLLSLLAVAGALAVPPFKHVYRILDKDSDPTAAGGGSVSRNAAILAHSTDLGAQLSYSRVLDSALDLFGGRFSDKRRFLWALATAPDKVFPGDPQDPAARPLRSAVTPLAGKLSRASVVYYAEDAVRFGIIQVARKQKSLRFAWQVAEPGHGRWRVSADHRHNHVVGRVDDDPDAPGIALLAVNGKGKVLFDRVYRSEAFAGPELGPQLSQGFGTDHWVVPRGRSGYDLFVTSYEEVDPTANHYVLRCTTLTLNKRGKVRGVHSMLWELPNSASGGCIGRRADDGAVLYAVLELDLATSTARTHVVKVNFDDTLAWARTIEGAGLTAHLASAAEPLGDVWDGDPLVYMAGYVPRVTAAFDVFSAGVIVRLDWETGQITHEFRFPEVEEIGSIVGAFLTDGSEAADATGDEPGEPNVYLLAPLPEGDLQTRTRGLDVVRLTPALENPAGFRRVAGEGWTMPILSYRDDRFLATEYREASAQVRAFALDPDFQALEPTCPSFEPVTVARASGGLQAVPLAMELLAPEVQSARRETQLESVKLPAPRLRIKGGRCADVSD